MDRQLNRVVYRSRVLPWVKYTTSLTIFYNNFLPTLFLTLLKKKVKVKLAKIKTIKKDGLPCDTMKIGHVDG